MRSPLARVLVASALTVALSATLALAAPKPAFAAKRAKKISRELVITRSKRWVRHKVPYSQSRYHAGYRQDCSGFVSMAWKTGRSYTTSTIKRVSHRINYRKAKPGDAVLRPGRHVAIFGGWHNKSRRTYYAYEESTYGKPAMRRIKKFTRGSQMIRRDRITMKTNRYR
ncbi:MAG TPA: hypothetical protein VLA05_04585 [Coriobacteriia bacterium]|nr:hypothetical protein [Coriobacteriia bacterium]